MTLRGHAKEIIKVQLPAGPLTRGQGLCAAPTPASRWARMAVAGEVHKQRLCSIDTPSTRALRRPQGRGLRGAKRAQLDPGQGGGFQSGLSALPTFSPRPGHGAVRHLATAQPFPP